MPFFRIFHRILIGRFTTLKPFVSGSNRWRLITKNLRYRSKSTFHNISSSHLVSCYMKLYRAMQQPLPSGRLISPQLIIDNHLIRAQHKNLTFITIQRIISKPILSCLRKSRFGKTLNPISILRLSTVGLRRISCKISQIIPIQSTSNITISTRRERLPDIIYHYSIMSTCIAILQNSMCVTIILIITRIHIYIFTLV